MKFVPKNVKKFQQGGEIAPEEAPMEEAPVEEGTPMNEGQGGGEDPFMMLAQMAAQALQNQDCQMAMQVCQGFLEVMQQMAGAQQQQGEPVFKKGGKLCKRIRK